jgi:uncharacterized protein (TIGR02266 family)
MIGFKPNSILLADDNDTFLMYVGILVKRLGYRTYLARDGEEAVMMAKEKKPSIIVLDYLMPKMNGSKCLHMIRGDEAIKNTPVIIITSQDRDINMDELERLGFCRFLNKPINIAVFYGALRGCLREDKRGLGINKRKNIRTSLSLRVSIECQDERRELFASELSEGGLYLRTIAPFSLGTVLDMVFKVDDEDPVELKGQVVYINSLSRELDTEPGIGVTFLEVPEDVKLRIHSLVMNQIANDLTLEGDNMDHNVMPEN